jgi:hypothetical protein
MSVVRRGLIGVLVAIFGIAASLGVGYPAGARSAKRHDARCAKAAWSKPKLPRRRAKCKKPRATTPRSTTPTTTAPATRPPPQALSATLIVHVSSVYTHPVGGPGHPGAPNCAELIRAEPPERDVTYECRGNERGEELTTKRSEVSELLVVTCIGAGGEALSSLETFAHTIHVAPGRYRIAREGLPKGYNGRDPQVTVSEGQTAEVSLRFVDE